MLLIAVQKHGYKAFTLIELLVVVGLIAALLAIVTPSLRRARVQAQIVAVNSDLYQVGLALEMYMNDNRGKHPPTRRDCGMGWDDFQLPPELVQSGYLPAPEQGSLMSARFEDRFNPGVTYKYAAVGPYFQNGDFMPDMRAALYVPLGFPADSGQPEDDVRHDDPDTSPVIWAIYSMGPNANRAEHHEWEMLNELNGPVAKRAWYTPEKQRGLLVRVRMRSGRHIGSFEGHP